MVTAAASDRAAPVPPAFRIWPWVVFATVLYLFFATAGRWYLPFSSDPARVRTFWTDAYYALLAEGLLRGQLSLAAEPSPHLLQHENPLADKHLLYRHALLDAALYKGKYYLYHGPAPALTVYLPLRVLCGVYPPAPAVVTLFLSVACALQLWLLRDVWRCYVPRAWPGLLHVSALVLVMQNGALFAISPSEFFEIACTSARCWVMAAFVLGYCYWFRSGRAWMLAGAAGCMVLATASRPHFALITALALGVAVLPPLRRSWRAWGWAAAVCAAGAASVMWYNVARFGDPFELGVRYQANMLPTAWTPVTSLRVLGANLVIGAQMYLLQLPHLTAAFPYLHAYVAPELVAHAGQYSAWREEMAGFLITSPMLVMGIPALTVVVWRARPHGITPVRAVLLALLTLHVVTALVLMSMPAVAMRYALDFVPGLLLAACLAVMACDQLIAMQHHARWAWSWRATAIIATLAGCVMHVLLGFGGRSNAFAYLWPGWAHPWRIMRHEAAHLCRPHRVETAFFANGMTQALMQVRMDTGARDGRFLTWHGNGAPGNRGTYRNNQPVGWWTWWHTNGVKAMEGRFSHGAHDQWWMWWHEDGHLEKESYYIRGTHVQTREN